MDLICPRPFGSFGAMPKELKKIKIITRNQNSIENRNHIVRNYFVK